MLCTHYCSRSRSRHEIVTFFTTTLHVVPYCTRGYKCTVLSMHSTCRRPLTFALNLRNSCKIEINMEAWEQKLLRKHYSFLLRSLDPETVRIALYSNDHLTQCEHDQIKAQTTPMAANELILEALKRRAPGTLEKVCRILEDEGGHQNVIEKLQEGRPIDKNAKLLFI